MGPSVSSPHLCLFQFPIFHHPSICSHICGHLNMWINLCRWHENVNYCSCCCCCVCRGIGVGGAKGQWYHMNNRNFFWKDMDIGNLDHNNYPILVFWQTCISYFSAIRQHNPTKIMLYDQYLHGCKSSHGNRTMVSSPFIWRNKNDLNLPLSNNW